MNDVRRRVVSSRQRFGLGLAALLCVAAALRGSFPLADPPWFSAVGIVWHDEGAWVHNARNRALFGEWQLPNDKWNPVFVAPVFTELEYLSFRTFGVGLWQARFVSQAMGAVAVLLLGLGVARLAGRGAALAAAALLATSFVTVMYDRAALMEATMVAFIVAAWYCYVRSASSPRWGLAAGAAAMTAYFTKASAVFFLAALAFDAALTVALDRRWIPSREKDARSPGDDASSRRQAAAWYTLAGLTCGGVIGLLSFILPNWTDYRFYNWQMSVTRKPVYTFKALVDRASWLPVVHNFFTRIWTVTVLAISGAWTIAFGWRRVQPGERVLLWWIVLGVAELILHDVGNERRLVFLMPALVVLAVLVLVRDRRLLDDRAARATRGRALLAAPFLLASLYLIAGAVIRLPFITYLNAGDFRYAVRWSAALAGMVAALLYVTWPRLPAWLARVRWTSRAATAVVLLLVAANAWQYWEWARIRTYKNHAAMVAIGRWLPPGTLVHGRLANGLALESRIIPVFVGRQFANYEDRASRPDIRYLVTYSKPWLGFDSQASNPVILDVLAASPGWKPVREFDVAETPWGRDRAVLIDKYPGAR